MTHAVGTRIVLALVRPLMLQSSRGSSSVALHSAEKKASLQAMSCSMHVCTMPERPAQITKHATDQ